MKKKRQNITITITVFLVLLILTLFTIWRVRTSENLDPKAEATETEVLYTFAVMTDTHSKDQGMWETYFKLLNKHNPDILFHTGDVGWVQHNTSKYHYGDYRYYPLRGIIDMQNSNKDLDIHISTGNHDIDKFKMDGGEYDLRLVDGIVEPACLGSHFYWGATDEEPYTHHEPNEVSLNPERKGDFRVFNEHILENNFCSSPYHKQSYTIVEGNIKFVIVGWDLLRDKDKLSEDRKWIIENVCGTEGVESTIVMSHDYTHETLSDEFIPLINTCDNNVDLVFQGHSHSYKKFNDGGYEVLKLVGGMRDRIADDGRENGINPYGRTQSDFAIGKVFKDRIEIDRYSFYNVDGSDLGHENLYTFQGSFDPLDLGVGEEISISYHLKPGIGLFAYPLDSNLSQASDLISYAHENGVDLSMISVFSDNKFKVYRKSKDSYAGENFELTPNESYLVNVEKGGEFKLNGYESEDWLEKLTDLPSGWHLVAFNVDDSISSSKDLMKQLDSKGVNVTSFYYLDRGVYRGCVYEEDSYYGEEFDVESDQGYWLLIE